MKEHIIQPGEDTLLIKAEFVEPIGSYSQISLLNDDLVEQAYLARISDNLH